MCHADSYILYWTPSLQTRAHGYKHLNPTVTLYSACYNPFHRYSVQMPFHLNATTSIIRIDVTDVALKAYEYSLQRFWEGSWEMWEQGFFKKESAEYRKMADEGRELVGGRCGGDGRRGHEGEAGRRNSERSLIGVGGKQGKDH